MTLTPYAEALAQSYARADGINIALLRRTSPTCLWRVSFAEHDAPLVRDFLVVEVASAAEAMHMGGEYLAAMQQHRRVTGQDNAYGFFGIIVNPCDEKGELV